MTDPSSITVSLEIAKMVKEAGWPQDDALFFWRQTTSGDWELITRTMLRALLQTGKEIAFYAAPTAEEILRRLPEYVGEHFWSIISEFRIRKWQKINGYTIYYPTKHEEWGDTLANATAAMWCYLKANNLLQDQSGQ